MALLRKLLRIKKQPFGYFYHTASTPIHQCPASPLWFAILRRRARRRRLPAKAVSPFFCCLINDTPCM